jgi:diamine N-acetyltransferase
VFMTGNKISLRALEPDDVGLLYRWENDMSIWHLSNTITPLSKFTLEQYVMDSALDIFATRQLRMMIDLNEETDGIRTIGSIDLFDYEPSHLRAGIGIMILKEFRGKGLASEALELLIHYAFDTLQMHQVYCNISTDNTESIRLFESKGFQLVGTKRDWNRIRNVWQDECLYQLLNHNGNI